jgi:hypothetical protein
MSLAPFVLHHVAHGRLGLAGDLFLLAPHLRTVLAKLEGFASYPDARL